LRRFVLNIGVIAHLKHAIKEPFAGGLEMHTHALCRGLRERGHAVTLFAAEGSDPDGLEPICPAMNDVAHSFRSEHDVYLELMTSLRQRPFDVIHNNSLHYLPVTMAAALPMPMVTTLHTPPFWELEGSMRLSRAPHHCYAAVSDVIRRAWQPINQVTLTVPNGIDLDQFPFCAVPDVEPYWIWYGRIVPEKGLHLALDAARLAGQPLRFAGPVADPEYYTNQIIPRMHGGAHYLGHLGHAQLAQAIGGARAFLCTPVWEEPYGLVVAESLACGTPVAGFARGALPDLVTAACGLLAPAGDVPGLAAAALAVGTLDRHACRRRAAAVADARHMLDGYAALYKDMIQRHPQVPRAAPAGLDAAHIEPTNTSLIKLYARQVSSMLCGLPAAP
jgi:glycosyltransferase involved in cell wall biosynthesis